MKIGGGAPLQLGGFWQMQNPKATELTPGVYLEFDGQEDDLCD